MLQERRGQEVAETLKPATDAHVGVGVEEEACHACLAGEKGAIGRDACIDLDSMLLVVCGRGVHRLARQLIRGLDLRYIALFKLKLSDHDPNRDATRQDLRLRAIGWGWARLDPAGTQLLGCGACAHLSPIAGCSTRSTSLLARSPDEVSIAYRRNCRWQQRDPAQRDRHPRPRSAPRLMGRRGSGAEPPDASFKS